jgi:hypothetical protein
VGHSHLPCSSRRLKVRLAKIKNHISIRNIKNALKQVFAQRISFIYAAVGTLVFLGVLVYLPITLTPGNDLPFFLDITPWYSLLAIAALSTGMGITIAMQVYVWRNTKRLRIKEVGTGVGAVFSTMLTGLFSTASCAACLSVIFSFILPPAGIFFLLKYQWWVVGGGILLVLVSLNLMSARITGNCKTCTAPQQAGKKQRGRKK